MGCGIEGRWKQGGLGYHGGKYSDLPFSEIILPRWQLHLRKTEERKKEYLRGNSGIER